MTQNNKFEGWTYVLALNYRGEAKYGYYVYNMTLMNGEVNGDVAFCIDSDQCLDVVNMNMTGCLMHSPDVKTMSPLAQEQVDRVLDSYNYEFKDGKIQKQFKLPDYFSYANTDKTRRYYIEVLSKDGSVITCLKYSCNYVGSEVFVKKDFIPERILIDAYLNNDGEEWDGEEESLIDYYVRS
jgi:hypothetical protein